MVVFLFFIYIFIVFCLCLLFFVFIVFYNLLLYSFSHSGVARGERRRAGVGLLIAPQLSRHVLEFTPVNERIVSLRFRAGDRSLAVVSA